MCRSMSMTGSATLNQVVAIQKLDAYGEAVVFS
jgi:hypothetical protein